MSALHRRRFLAASAFGATLALGGARASGRVLGANDAIRVGVVGVRGRGQLHMAMTSSIPGFRLAALCDVDPAVLGRLAEKAGRDGPVVRTFKDVRELIACKDVDAVTIATPNHWHALAAIWACQAGKDVYLEKPVSHNIFEGRQLVSAARKYGRMVQAGTQARSNPDVIEAVAWVRAGNLGEIKHARGTCYKPRMSIGKVGKGQVPPGLDYDLWTGPAPLKPLARQNLHYDWHWIYDYGNGDLGNQGIHETDLARWFLGYDKLSSRVMSVGARLGYEDDGQTPNTQLVMHVYDGPPLVCEVRGLPQAKSYQASAALWSKNMDRPAGFPGGPTIGVIVVCEGGKLVIVDGGEAALAMDAQDKVIRRFEKKDPQRGIGWHKGDWFIFENWQAAMHSRRAEDLAAEVLEGHLSSALCHTGMISHRLGRGARAEEIAERCQADRLTAEHFQAMKEHLERNGVDLSEPRVALGVPLAFDPAGEKFIDNDSANRLLRRADRAPYVVPEEV